MVETFHDKFASVQNVVNQRSWTVCLIYELFVIIIIHTNNDNTDDDDND